MAKGPMQVEVKMTELEVVKELSGVLLDMTRDERVPMNVREEYVDRVNAILEKPPDSSKPL